MSGNDTKDTSTSGTIQPASQWTTGDDPMTEKQAAFLSKLAQEKGADVDLESTNKARASELIDELKSKPASNAPAKAGEPIINPEKWSTGGEAATAKQKAYIAVLEKKVGAGETERALANAELSKAEASERIEDLKQRTAEE